MRSRSRNVTDFEQILFDLIIKGQVLDLDMTVQRYVPRFCIG